MIELCAFVDPGRHSPQTRLEPTSHGTYFKEFRRDDLCMLVKYDRPIDAIFFDGPEFSLICRADLLRSDSASPAECLAQLYAAQGDSFAVKLRGTSAIIVYDYRTRTLKAWTDHFGAER